MTLGDRIVVLADGRIQQVGAPIDLYRRPVNRFVAGFIGSPPMNFIDGRVDDSLFVADGVRVLLSDDPRRDGPVTLGVRPEDLSLASSAEGRARLTGRVVLIERLGATSHVHVEVGANRLLASVSEERLPVVGESVDMFVAPARVHLFAADGRAL